MIAKVLQEIGVHGCLIAATMAEMRKLRGTAACGAEIRYSRCPQAVQGGGTDTVAQTGEVRTWVS